MIRFLEHLGKYVRMLGGMFTKPENFGFYLRELSHQCAQIGFGSFWIVAIISIFLGAVTTVQTAYQLVSPLVDTYVIAQIIRDSAFLELSPTIISIVLAGVVGSKIASELGNMRVSEQIDALEIMGINSKTYLILPKVIGALIMIPILVLISMILTIFGGFLAAKFSGVVDPAKFDYGLHADFVVFNVTFGLIKSVTFAFIISSVSSYYGYFVEGGSFEIGKASTTSVVVSCILILFADYGLAALLLG